MINAGEDGHVTLAHFESEPTYGSGVYRRRVLVTAREKLVLATVNDTHHAMWLLFRHDGDRVTAIESAIERGPATTCTQAPEALSNAVGLALDTSPRDLAGRLPPAANCTHLADLLRWSLRAARQRVLGSTEYRITVPDSAGPPVWLEVARNGTVVHRWQVDGETIVAPYAFVGRPLLRGFMKWAAATFDDDQLEAAVMLQRGAWVARGRRYVVDRTTVPLKAAVGMKDACFSYSGSNWTSATNIIGYVRDFTSGVVEHPLPDRIHTIMQEDQNGTA